MEDEVEQQIFLSIERLNIRIVNSIERIL